MKRKIRMIVEKNVVLPGQVWIDVLRVLQSNVVWNTNRERRAVEEAVEMIEDSIFLRLNSEMDKSTNQFEMAEPPTAV